MGRRADSPRALSLLLALNSARRRGDADFAAVLQRRLERSDEQRGFQAPRRFEVEPADSHRQERYRRIYAARSGRGPR